LRRIDVKHAAIAVWGVVFLLAVVFAGELRWAAQALPLYLVHEFPPLQERVHAAEALRLANEEQDLAAALVEIAASEAIDPNAFPFLHAELERRAGQRDAALQHYERANFVDPSDAGAWLRRAELREELGRPDESRQVLREGLAWFAENLLLFEPAPDPGVAPRYNAKAEQTYTDLQRAVTTLRTALSSTN
jgi:tetratricopeptide (TPR) repeat protein